MYFFNMTIIQPTPQKDAALFRGQKKSRENQSKGDKMDIKVKRGTLVSRTPDHA